MDPDISPVVQGLIAAPAVLLALFLVTRIGIRYERMSIADLRNDRAADRDLVAALRLDVGLLQSHVTEARERGELAYLNAVQAQAQVAACEQRSAKQEDELKEQALEIKLFRLALDGVNGGAAPEGGTP